jgi:hypothetical protein
MKKTVLRFVLLVFMVLGFLFRPDISHAQVAPGVNCVNITSNPQNCTSFICNASPYTFCCTDQNECIKQLNYMVNGPTPSPTPASGGSAGSPLGGGGCNANSIDTAIGCIPVLGSQEEFLSFALKWAVGIGGGIAFLLIVYAGFMIMTSSGNPERLKAGQELLTSAIWGLLLLIFSIVILKIIGIDILGLSGLGISTT